MSEFLWLYETKNETQPLTEDEIRIERAFLDDRLQGPLYVFKEDDRKKLASYPCHYYYYYKGTLLARIFNYLETREGPKAGIYYYNSSLKRLEFEGGPVELHDLKPKEFLDTADIELLSAANQKVRSYIMRPAAPYRFLLHKNLPGLLKKIGLTVPEADESNKGPRAEPTT